MSSASCIFCAIAAGNAHADVVFQTEHAICFLPLEMEVPGHSVIAPKLHYATLFEIPDEELLAVIQAAKAASERFRAALGATGVNLLHASGRSAQQSVDHFHVHVLPRVEADGIDAWPRLPGCTEDRRQLLTRLQGAGQ